jgi:hypothetical protein
MSSVVSRYQGVEKIELGPEWTAKRVYKTWINSQERLVVLTSFHTHDTAHLGTSGPHLTRELHHGILPVSLQKRVVFIG